MKVSLDKIINVKPIKTSSRRVNYNSLYTLFCGIECEYAISVLKKNKDDGLFKQISSYFLTNDMSAKTLFIECFSFDDEMLELHARLQFNEGDDSYIDVLKNIEIDTTVDTNKYVIGDFSFTSEKLFLDIKEKDGDYYALGVKSTDEGDEFTVIGSKEDSLGLSYIATTDLKTLLKTEEVDFTKYKYLDTPQLTDEQFFQITTKLKEADDEQKEAIRAGTDRNLLIIAGAGSGKTRSLVGRLTYLHTVKGIPLNRIILLTFTRAATQEMGLAAYQQIKEAYLTYGMPATKNPLIQARTIDGFFKYLIDKYYYDIGLENRPVFLLDEKRENERLRLLVDVIKENQLTSVFKDYFSNSSDYKARKSLNELYDSLEDVANGKVVNISGVENLLELYIQKQIDECIVVDFVYTGCIIKKALENPNCPLYQRIEELYDCILIDEFQDINKLQNDVLSKFYNSHTHFTFVGDDDQTIYTWRGADNSIIKSMSQDKKVYTVYLTTNYRNNPYIVNAGNDILAAIEDRAKVGREIKPAKQTGCKIRITTYDDQYENLANEIRKAYETRSPGEKICVLCRQVNDRYNYIDGQKEIEEGEGTKIARMLELCKVRVAKFKDDGIYYSEGYKILKALVCILNKIEVRNNCAYIKEVSGSRASNTNIRKLVFGKISSQRLDMTQSVFNVDVISKLANAVNTQFTFANSFHDLVCNYNRVFSKEVEKQISSDRDILDEALRLFESVSARYNWAYPMEKEQIKNVFGHFEEEIIRKTTKKEIDEEDDKDCNVVTISSIHKAKGLQYDTVFIVGLNAGECPNTDRIYKDYNKSIGQFQKLKASQDYLKALRATIGKDRIDGLINDCKSENWAKTNDRELIQDMNDMAEDIDACSDDYIALSEDGVDAYLDAFEVYINKHITERRELINKKNNEIAALQETADLKEEEYHEAEEDSEEAQRLYKEWEILLQEVKAKKLSLNAYTTMLDTFLNGISNLVAFYETCKEAKGYLADVKKLRNEAIMIKKLEKEKQDKEREEKRLFYVAVSRASEKLYLCVREDTQESEFIKLINPENCEKYVMLTKYQEDEIQRLSPYIQELREETEKETVNDKKIEKSVEKILNFSDEFKNEMQDYLNKYIAEHPQYQNLPNNAKVYFNNAIELVAFSEKLGLSFKEATAHYILKFIHQMLLERVGKKAKSFKTDSNSASKIIADIRKIAKSKCKAGMPGEGYLLDLLTKEAKFSGDEFERCKSLVIQCYIICSGKYRVPDYISGTWGIKSFNKDNPENFLVSALDLTNIRNVMIHDKMELWTTDYLPYAFECMDTIMLYIGQAESNTIQYNEDIELNESVVQQKLYSIIIQNKNLITDITKLHSLISDYFDAKISKVLCIVDVKILKDIVSGMINSKRGTDVAYLRNNSRYSNDMCLQVVSIWEDIIDNQTKEILKKIV